MRHISAAYTELDNLHKAALWHKEHCRENCGISLRLLAYAGRRIYRQVLTSERAEAEKMIIEMEALN